ncbi:MAG: DeoR/GlpR family DNA-binding transcription regulator [Bacilli bacterium]|nr:DeoR/GlpR family DNA-binding transcription regulator [Bacilli bacterium]
MLKEARLSLILQAVNERNYVSLHDLMALTDSSESTIRADLIALAKEGKIIRLRGGAQAISGEVVSYELSNEIKMDIEYDAKRKIGQHAASLIKDRATIFIDAGTTTIHILDYINAKDIYIVTNSLSIAKKAKINGYKVTVTGGDIKLSTDAFVGSLAQEIISHFTFDVGFFGCNGVDITNGVTTPEVEEALIKQAAMNRCKRVFILADSTKFGIKTAITFHPFIGSEFITDKITNNKFLDKGIVEVK